MMNFNNKRTKRIMVGVIAVVLALAMLVPTILSAIL